MAPLISMFLRVTSIPPLDDDNPAAYTGDSTHELIAPFVSFVQPIADLVGCTFYLWRLAGV
jgi:hypothetical protein